MYEISLRKDILEVDIRLPKITGDRVDLSKDDQRLLMLVETKLADLAYIVSRYEKGGIAELVSLPPNSGGE